LTAATDELLNRVRSRVARSRKLPYWLRYALARSDGHRALTRVRSLAEAELKLDEASAFPTEAERIEFLAQHYLVPDGGFDHPEDPFSDDYREWAHELWSRISGRTEAYDPAAHELSGYQDEVDMRSPPPYNIESGELLGDTLICWGFLVRTLDLKPGQSVLEYGPGSGQILLQFARMGVRAAGVDIDPVQVAFIREQGKRLGLDIRVRVGQFGDTIEPGERYDAVIFFEAFHHALDHVALVERLHEVVTEDGALVIAADVVVDLTNRYWPVMPFPWGPRVDLLSVRAMRTHGWMELGFREEYFLELMERSGWAVTRHDCPQTIRGMLWLARH
jgi:2-polyprenyl-3-methyl-5-hydroxy-6-metoxy-1,4-benzoquinol methylase